VIPSRRNWTIIFYNNEVQLRHEIWPEIRGSIKEEKAEAYILAGGFKVVSDNDFVICYVRFIPEEAIIVICSTDEETREVNIPVNIFGIHHFNITEDLFHNKLQYEYSGTSLTMKVPPHTSYIFCVPCQ
jgi:alpha-glucosidase